MSILKFFKKNKKEKKSKTKLDVGDNIIIDKLIANQIDDIDWKSLETAYGNAKPTIPKYLKNIYSENNEIAIEATHKLWCSLCHQHGYISPASVPAYEIIKNRLIECNDKLKIELFDIMLGFAICSNDKSENSEYQELIFEMKNKIVKDKEIFEEYTNNKNLDIKKFAELIIEQVRNFE